MTLWGEGLSADEVGAAAGTLSYELLCKLTRARAGRGSRLMAKPKTAYVCSECGATALQWFGACPSCGAAGTLTETVDRTRRGLRSELAPSAARRRLAEVQPKDLERIPTGIGELDRALGGGLVAGQVVLLGGDPGIGKSTLLLQALSTMADSVLYVTGEESVEQVALRARRLGLETSGVRIAAETQLERVLGALEAARPQHRGDRLDPDAVVGGAAVGAGLGGAGARVRGAAHAPRQARRHRAVPRRPRHQGGRDRRAARARAHRRHGALLRGRPAFRPSAWCAR